MIITINLPTLFIGALNTIVNDGEHRSRSEAIRVALNDFLTRELSMIDILLELNDGTKRAQSSTKKPEQQKPKSKRIDMRSIRTGWN